MPRWLARQGATVIIAGGMGIKARDKFAEQSIQVVIGASSSSPRELVERFLAGTLSTGENACDHASGHEPSHTCEHSQAHSH
jgi:predicted Fe-Mo cluster-binding NifX family protein